MFLVICLFHEISNFEVLIFVIVYFQLLKPSLKLRKREFDWSIRDLFSQLKKRKQIFVLQNSKFRQISKLQDDIHTTFEYNKFLQNDNLYKL